MYDRSDNNYQHYPSHHRRHYEEEEYDPFGGFGFVFRDPDEVFREFFGGAFPDLFFETAPSHSHVSTRNQRGHHQPQQHHQHHHRNSHPQSNEISASFFSPFMGFQMMDDFFRVDGDGFGASSGNGFTSISTVNTFGGGGGGGGGGGRFKRTSTSTSIVNGKKITTKKFVDLNYLNYFIILIYFTFRIIENGKETVIVYENGLTKSKTVNGVPQAITH